MHVRDVARRAGVTYSAVQFHFGNRDALIDAAYIELYRLDLIPPVNDAAQVFAAARDVNAFVEAVRLSLGKLFRHERASHRRRRLQVLGAAVNRPALGDAIADIHREFFERFALALEVPLARGWLKPGLDLRALATLHLGIMNARSLVEDPRVDVDPMRWDEAAMDALLSFTTWPGPVAAPRDDAAVEPRAPAAPATSPTKASPKR